VIENKKNRWPKNGSVELPVEKSYDSRNSSIIASIDDSIEPDVMIGVDEDPDHSKKVTKQMRKMQKI
jgi:hypothetical protein